MILQEYYCLRLRILFGDTYGCIYPIRCASYSVCLLSATRERPDTIRSIVANLVGDDETGDSLVDENEPIQPLQYAEMEDYTDPNWEPEPIDAGPGKLHNSLAK